MEKESCPWSDIVEFFSAKSIERRKENGIKIITKLGSSRIYFYEEGQTKHHYLDGGNLKDINDD